MSLLSQVRGFPSHATKDIYGLNTKLELQTFEIQWTNEEDDPAAQGESSVTELGDETKQTFKDVVDSIAAAGRQFATRDSAV